MSLVVVGLGNPGEKYEGTRHNIGFAVLDALAAKRNLVFSKSRLSETARFSLAGETVWLVKPLTYMNLSGDAVLQVLSQSGAKPENLVVITDDLALPFGSIRIRSKGSAGGHNGLTDIENKIKTQAYNRMRMGIGSDFPKGRQAEYVLSPFAPEEKEGLEIWINRAVEAILVMASRGITQAMNQFNG